MHAGDGEQTVTTFHIWLDPESVTLVLCSNLESVVIVWIFCAAEVHFLMVAVNLKHLLEFQRKQFVSTGQI